MMGRVSGLNKTCAANYAERFSSRTSGGRKPSEAIDAGAFGKTMLGRLVSLFVLPVALVCVLVVSLREYAFYAFFRFQRTF